jgi:hypothetical protein
MRATELEANQEKRAEIKIGLEEIRGTELEANQEKRDPAAEHYERVPHAEATHTLTTQKGWASDVLHGVPKEVTQEETIEAPQDCFGDQHLVTAYHSHLKSRAQCVRKSLQELATAVEELTHCTLPALPENHGCKEAGMMFGDGIRGRDIQQQLLLGSKRNINEAIRQTFELDIVKPAVRSPIRLQKTSDRALWQSWHPSKQKKRLPTAYMPPLRGTSNFRRFYF